MQVAKYWRNNKLRYRLLGMKQHKDQPRAVLRPASKSVPNREERLRPEQVHVGG